MAERAEVKKIAEVGKGMSLIVCPECNRKVSEYAEWCPNCGCPIEIIKLRQNKQEEVVERKENSNSTTVNTYSITLLDTHDNNLRVARYLRILCNIGVSESMSIVGKIPCVLFKDVDEETKNQIEEVFNFYEVVYETKQTGHKDFIPQVTSKKIIYVGSKYGDLDRTSYIYLGREYDFPFSTNFSDAPFVLRDSTSEEDAKIIQEELNNLGVYTQIIDSENNVKPIVSSLKREASIPTKSKPIITCPYCGSINIIKVSAMSRITSTATVGVASKKIGKQWKCNNCKSYF